MAFLRQISTSLAYDNDGGRQSFIRSFVEAEGGRDRYDYDELLFILRDMIVAGSETSSTTVMWAIVLLASRPDVQRRLHSELDTIVGNSAARLPSLSDRQNMPYIEATILELMRYKTIVPLSVPRETSEETIVEGYTIPTGTMVRLCCSLLCMSGSCISGHLLSVACASWRLAICDVVIRRQGVIFRGTQYHVPSPLTPELV